MWSGSAPAALCGYDFFAAAQLDLSSGPCYNIVPMNGAPLAVAFWTNCTTITPGTFSINGTFGTDFNSNPLPSQCTSCYSCILSPGTQNLTQAGGGQTNILAIGGVCNTFPIVPGGSCNANIVIST